MKIAIASDDGATISQHFGRAPFYIVVTVEDGKITGREQRDREHCHQTGTASHAGEHHHHGDQHEHTHSHHAPDRHARMASAISDCEAVLAGGMGNNAYNNLLQYGVKPIITDILSIDKAIATYLEGQLIDHIERLH